MSYRTLSPRHLVALFVVAGALLATILAPGAAALAAPPAVPVAVTVEIEAIEDIGVIESAPAFTGGGAPYFVLNSRPGGDFDWNFVRFDLSALPAGATINSAQFRLYVNASANALDIEMGRVDGAWSEATTSWNTKPAVTWAGAIQNAPAVGNVDWPIKPLLEGWLAGTQNNFGIALRGVTPATGGVRADTRDGAIAPRLVVNYTIQVDDGARPDFGDAPDSSNHHGVVNSAYAGVPGRFPSVWEGTAAGQPAGPRHANQSMEGWLGDFLSREADADVGLDQDGPNNILRAAGGAIGDVADNDRGDDGWRNRQIKFFDCRRTTLDVRVSKAPGATRNFMVLNVWFDGNRDGDWEDISPCQSDETGPAQASYEWIVQNYIVDMTAVPAGGSLDFTVNTEKVLNSTPGAKHWLRFTLSETPAVQPSGALADGRGPHPSANPDSYLFGETEDILQTPPPAGQDGTLELQKRVITTAEPTEWIDYVTYEIRLRHNGGTQPVQAQIRDALPYPLIVYPTIDGGGVHYVNVTSTTGGATPLLASLDIKPNPVPNPPQQVVNWQGSLAPDAEVTLSFKVRVLALCDPNQQTMTFTNTAFARPQGGTVITAQDTFTAKCIGYQENQVQWQLQPITDVVNLGDLMHLPVQYRVTNGNPVSVTLNVYQPAGAVQTSAAGQTPSLAVVSLLPNETKLVDLVLRMESEFSDELTLPDDYTPGGPLAFCLMPDAGSPCPAAQEYPNLHGDLPPVQVKVRPNDLGDAPDNTNHAAAAMTAYPGVPATFPTVFDPATGQPQGPRHAHPRPFHLGQRVSLEAEADIGPDQDPFNNIVPAANDPDNDRGDDGTNLALWNLANCQPAVLPVQVFISPQAVAYFTQLGTPGYLNVWVDGNRNGTWQDAVQCGAQPAPEHIVIDYAVNVVGLGAGLHTLNVPSGRVPLAAANQPAWVRITLSEIPSNKTLVAGAIQYGDGRGYAQPFKTGETEDFLYFPAGVAGGGADFDVRLSAKARRGVADIAGVQAAGADKLGNFDIQIFKIDYANRGSATAQNALLEFQIPEKFRGQTPQLQASTLPSDAFTLNFEEIKVTFRSLAPGDQGTIVLGWYGCITCTVTASSVEQSVTASVTVTLPGDVDPSNNQSSATLEGLLSSPIIGAFMDYTDDALMDRIFTGRAASCRATQTLRGKAEPNRIIAILIGNVVVGTTTSDANGFFSHTVNLSTGLHRIGARYANTQVTNAAMATPEATTYYDASSPYLALLVDNTLPFDPMSVTFTDSQGRTLAVPVLGYSFGASQTGSFFRAGETYKVGVDLCDPNPNARSSVTFGDVVISSLLDADGDGRFYGWATFPALVQAAAAAATGDLALIVSDGATESRYGFSIATGAAGIVTDRATGQPLAGATVAALTGTAAGDGSTTFGAWDASLAGQTNPQQTGADGGYLFTADVGTFQLDVSRSGYQAYRTGEIDAANEALARTVALSPAIAEAATQTIAITEQGFVPPTVAVAPGGVVAFVNADLAEHAVRGSGWDSGMLAPGATYKVRAATVGSFSYADATDALNKGVVIVAEGAGASRLFLPAIVR